MSSIINADTSDGLKFTSDTSGEIKLQSAGTDTVTVDSSGNVGIGTSSPTYNLDIRDQSGVSIDVSDAQYPFIGNQFSSNDDLVVGSFGDVIIHADYNNNTGQNIIFKEGTSENMRIGSSGNVFINTTTNFPGSGNTAGGFMVESANGCSLFVSRADNVPCYFNRNNDGVVITIRESGTEEGSISVSGTTVSYNGGHLSRFAQLPNRTKDESILKGTVLSNLDEMCVYVNKETGETADNEQLNKVKVSDVEGDPNVAGVHVSWMYDEQHDVEEINMAMTGDMIIRIAQGVTVNRGDLLMSAGDGTAKPQGDDIVRSKTIAKVTSTNVTCTYDDGSYCVPCVLMAC